MKILEKNKHIHTKLWFNQSSEKFWGSFFFHFLNKPFFLVKVSKKKKPHPINGQKTRRTSSSSISPKDKRDSVRWGARWLSGSALGVAAQHPMAAERGKISSHEKDVFFAVGFY